ncbi:spermidine/putrescine ABC transporter substrate-binding protein [Candidatus Saccharibacteria bacterium]|nr:spermidine/putrescine ABC transporter substrate-binding protein [Candidatus Saccharibacteria bacterium]
MNTFRDFLTSKKLLLLFLFSLLVISFASVFFVNFRSRSDADEPTSEKVPTLNVLNWTSYIPSEVISDFETEYGVKVNYGTYSSNEELLAKVSSAKSGTYDLIFPSDYMVDLMSSRDLLETLDKSKLKNLDNLNPRFLSQSYDENNLVSLPFLLATSVILYDSEKISTPLTSYHDLLREDFRDNLVLLDDERITIGSFLLASGADLNSVETTALENSLAFYEKLKPNVKAFDSDSPKTFFITGEVDAGIIWNAEALLAQTERENLKIVYPSEGFALSMDNYCILKHAKNPDLAYLFIDYLLRDDVSQAIVDEYPYISPNRSVTSLPDSELETILARGTYVKNVGNDIKKFDKLWAKYK